MTRVLERRIVDAKIEVRENADGTVGVRGYAAVFDKPAHGEVIRSAAFNRTIAQKQNVRFLINHEGTPLASTRAGTMTIGVDDVGEWFDIPALDVANNPRAAEFASSVGRGDMYQCSFAGYFRDAPMVGGVREVREVEQVDISGVTFPWYEDAQMELTGDRSADRQLISARSADDVPVGLTPEQTVNALRALRAAPPGKSSYSDLEQAICVALDASFSTVYVYIYVVDFGADWLVFRAYSSDYEMSELMQCSWVQASDGSFAFGVPFQVDRITEYRPTPTDPGPVEVKSHTVDEARALLAALTSAA